MTGDVYQKLTGRTVPEDCMAERLTNFALGLAGEAGELVDHIKKILYQGHPLNKDLVIEEAGDVLWYIAGILREFDISLSGTMEFNIEKLKKRYPNGFEVSRSINRKEFVAIDD